ERGRRRELEVNSSAPVRVRDQPHLSIRGCQMSFTPHVTRRTVVKLGPLGGNKIHKMVKFRPRGMVDKREMEQAQLFETADERGCTPMFGAAHRRGSACIGGSLPLHASHFTAHVHACARLSSSILISTRRRNQSPCRK